MREGTIVDATIISAPSSIKNQDKKRAKEMKQTKKGNQWYFGMRPHVGTDTRKGLAHSVVVTGAAVHDSQVMDELIHGEEQAVCGHRAYTSEKKRQEYEAGGIKWCINHKACRHYQLTPEDVAYNRRQSQIRAKGEHAFLIVKRLRNYQKVRYNGQSKNMVQMFRLFAVANLYLVRHELQAMGA